MDTENIRELGRLTGKVDGMESRLDKIEPKIDAMYNAITQAQGGWKTLLAVGGAAAGVGSFVTWLLSFRSH